MSELFDDDPRETAPPPRGRSRRSRALIITAVVVIAAIFALSIFAGIYTDRLWYQSIGYGSVFSTLLWTRVLLFVVFGLVMAASVAAAMYFAFRHRPLVGIPGQEQTSLDRYREVLTPIRKWVLIGVAVIVGAFAGASGMGQWRTYLLWRNAQDFPGQTDEFFGKNIGYYVFQLPWQHYVVDFVMAAAALALVASVVVHYLYGGIRLQVADDRLSGAAQVQISVLLGIFVLAKGVDYYLDRFDLVSQENRLFTGMNYTAENAVLPAKNILIGVALICAVLFFLNVWRRTWQLPSVGLALLALSSVLLGLIWPAVVQQFQVKPSEADKEAPYVQANIDATRDAYDLDDVETSSFAGTTATDDPTLAALTGETTDIPVVDPKLVTQTFEQLQQVRKYYSVSDVLDVDRYTLDGVDTPLVLGARELDQTGIDPSDRNWSNLHTVYTHGEGIIAAEANAVTSNPNDRIKWAEGIRAGEQQLSSQDDYESRIYFGEKSPDYSIVGKAESGSESVELGLPRTDEEGDEEGDGETTTTYDGSGGVDVGNTFKQLMYAIKFGEPNFLLSGRVNDNSKVIYDREPAERVKKVAPWLTLDSDSYPAVVDGRILWIVDGYTTTDHFPQAQRESFDSMIDDSLQQQQTGLQTLPTDEINYMRSAVKATVDAYDGTVKLYAWDEDDPMLKAWEGAFPNTVLPKDSIPDSLMEHLRYPEDLFKVQRYQYARYHVTDPGDFYQGNNRWSVPSDPTASTKYQPPYRFFVNQEGTPEGEQTWALNSVFVPRGKENLSAFVSVDSEATSPNFGKLRVLEITDSDADGPGLIANKMAQDQSVRSRLLSFENSASASPPVKGNLLTVPVADGLIYAQPVYAISAGSGGYPILQFVIVSYKDRVGIGTDLVSALRESLLSDETGGTGNEGDTGDGNTGGQPTTPPTSEPSDPETSNPPVTGNVNSQIRQLLNQADAAFTAADEALENKNTVQYARLIEKGRQLIDRAVALADERDGN